MEEHPGRLEDRRLLNGLADEIEGDADRETARSFMGFCSQLLSVRPKADDAFKLALARDLLRRHPAYVEGGAEARSAGRLKTAVSRLKDRAAMAARTVFGTKPLRYLAFGSAPALVIVLALIIAVGNPRVDIARAVEILENDPQINAVIKAYGLRVRHVKMWDHLGYILLDRDPDFEDVEVTIVVDLKSENVWKLVAQEGRILSKREITAYLDDKEAHWARKKREWAVEADRRGMTFEAYLAHIVEKSAAAFELGAAAKGMTPDEYKAYLYSERAFRAKAWLAEFTAEAESMGMTIEEYKAYLERTNAGKAKSDLADKAHVGDEDF